MKGGNEKIAKVSATLGTTEQELVVVKPASIACDASDDDAGVGPGDKYSDYDDFSLRESSGKVHHSGGKGNEGGIYSSKHIRMRENRPSTSKPSKP